MEIKLTKDQLECLISDGTYGDDSIYIAPLKSERQLDEKFSQEYLQDRTYEEKLADRLLAGGHVYFNMPDDDEDDDEYERYLTLEDFNKGMEKAAIVEPKHYADFMTGNDDFVTAYILLQVIAYGEAIFG